MKTILFIGQTPARPSSKHEIPGTYLHAWLHSINFSDQDITDHCHFFALTDLFPGASKHGHKTPTPEQIAAYRPKLQFIISSLKPEIVVPVGKLAISEILREKDPKLIETIGKSYVINPLDSLDHSIPCIPLSHPSGRSTWNALHKDLVQKALTMLQEESRNNVSHWKT